MKRPEENCYVHSANLFKFCKEALNIKQNFEVKVIDQHVGAILGYDPADSSHWKKGKKNIRSVQTLETIADHLEIDRRMVVDLVAGRISLEECVQEYRGYGSFALARRQIEELKREFTKNPSRFVKDGETRNLDDLCSPQRERSLKLTQDLLSQAKVRSTPVHIPEIVAELENVELTEGQPTNDFLVETLAIDKGFRIVYRAGEMKPHLRFLIAREIGRILLVPALVPPEGEEILAPRLNLFAMLLLLPSPLFALATLEASPTRDLIDQLAEFFWVSRSVVNARFKDFLIHNN